MTEPLRFFRSPELVALGIPFEKPREGDAGFDLRASVSLVIEVGGQTLVPTGLFIAVPTGWVGIIKDRSSMASKRIYTHAGVIDAGYRGEVKIVMSNSGDADYHVEAGAKVAQLIVIPALTASEESASLDLLGSTHRGDGGFGSTGKW